MFRISCSISFKFSLYLLAVNLTASVKPPPGILLILVKLNRITPELRPTPFKKNIQVFFIFILIQESAFCELKTGRKLLLGKKSIPMVIIMSQADGQQREQIQDLVI